MNLGLNRPPSVTSPRGSSRGDTDKDSEKKEEKKEDKPAAAADGEKKAEAAADQPAAAADKAAADGAADKPAEAAAAEGGDAKQDKEGADKEKEAAAPAAVPSDPATWPQPEPGVVVNGVKWMAKVGCVCLVCGCVLVVARAACPCGSLGGLSLCRQSVVSVFVQATLPPLGAPACYPPSSLHPFFCQPTLPSFLCRFPLLSSLLHTYTTTSTFTHRVSCFAV